MWGKRKTDNDVEFIMKRNCGQVVDNKRNNCGCSVEYMITLIRLGCISIPTSSQRSLRIPYTRQSDVRFYSINIPTYFCVSIWSSANGYVWQLQTDGKDSENDVWTHIEIALKKQSSNQYEFHRLNPSMTAALKPSGAINFVVETYFDFFLNKPTAHRAPNRWLFSRDTKQTHIVLKPNPAPKASPRQFPRSCFVFDHK